MRRTILASLGAAFLLTAGAVEAQTLKIGYINSLEILDSTPGAAEAQTQYDEQSAAFQAELTRLENELTGMEQQLERQQLTLSPEAKANREAQLQTKFAEYQNRRNELAQQAQALQAQLVQPIMDRINQVIEAVREEGNYALILDVAAGSIISADPSLDLTDEVVRRLQASADTSGGA